MTMAGSNHYTLSSGPEEHKVYYKLCLDDLDLALLPMNKLLNEYAGDYGCCEDVCEFEVFMNKCYQDEGNGAELNENLKNKSNKANNFGDLSDKEISESVNSVKNIEDSEKNKEKREKTKVNSALNQENAIAAVGTTEESDKINEQQIKNEVVLTNYKDENILLEHNDDNDNDDDDGVDDGDYYDDDNGHNAPIGTDKSPVHYIQRNFASSSKTSKTVKHNNNKRKLNEKTDKKEKKYCVICNVTVTNNIRNMNEHKNERLYKETLNIVIEHTFSENVCVSCFYEVVFHTSQDSQGHTQQSQVEEHINERKHRAAVAACKFYCNICNVPVPDKDLTEHKNRRIHKEKVIEKTFCGNCCIICKVKVSGSQASVEQHINGRKHKARVIVQQALMAAFKRQESHL